MFVYQDSLNMICKWTKGTLYSKAVERNIEISKFTTFITVTDV